VLIAAVLGACVAVALALSGGKDHPAFFQAQAGSTISTETTPMTETETTPSDTETTSTGTTAAEGSLPSVSTTQMETEIQQMLLEWHTDVVNGDYHAAWELLSHRKQEQATRESGYAAWVKNQETLRPYLNPEGLKAAIQGTEAGEGVAEVEVTGMTWSKPGSKCKQWSGITWVKYEGGAWKYDPGYSTTPQREQQWKSRFSELLGGRC
jgi:hypothetical protein